MINRIALLGKVRLASPSLSASAMVPTAEVELRQGRIVKKAVALLDSGMQGTHVMVSQAIADELGIVITGKAIQGTASGRQEVLVGKIDLIRLPGLDACAVANAIVTVGGDGVWLGQPFLAATGATIIYTGGGAALTCSGKPSPAIGVFPQFSFDLLNKGRRETLTAVLDTGFNGGLSIPEDVAARLGVEKKGTLQVTTPHGKAEVGVSTIDRVSFSGHPKCGVDSLETFISSEQSPTKEIVLLGESFLSRIPKKSAIGYDGEGVFAFCREDNTKIRATKSIYLAIIPPEDLPLGVKPTLIVPDRGGSAWIPWAVGSVALGGIAFAVYRQGR